MTTGEPAGEAPTAGLDRLRRDVTGSVIIRMADFGEFFATRERGRRLIGEIDALPCREAVILEWDGVHAVTGAFMSEMTAWLYKTSRRVGNRAMNEDVQEAYALACRRHAADELTALTEELGLARRRWRGCARPWKRKARPAT